MYTRDFGGIRSDGQLYNMEHGYYDDDDERQSSPPPPPPPPPHPEPEPHRRGGILSGGKPGFLRDIKLDDLLLIAIGILLLLDSDTENDLIVLLVVALLLF